MNFYGQQRILRELNLLIPEIKQGRNYNILFSAPTGCGKTTLAFSVIQQLGGLDVASLCYPPEFLLSYENKVVVLVDEVHEMHPQEFLYPYLDWGSPSYILATNEMGLLKEPLINRCIPFVFEPYSIDDILNIVKDTIGFQLEDEVYMAIAEKGKLNPRVTKLLCKRLGYIFRNYGFPHTAEELDNMAEQILNLSKNGLNPIDRQYLQVLQNAGGRASLNLIANSLRIDKAAIVRDIEPQLIYLKLITISSKGRELVNVGN